VGITQGQEELDVFGQALGEGGREEGRGGGEEEGGRCWSSQDVPAGTGFAIASY